MRWLSVTLRIALLLALAVWLTDQPGTARIIWHEYIIETSAALLALGVVIFAYALYLIYRFWRLIIDGPRFWRMRRQITRLHKGQDHLTRGLVAIAAGDASEAGRLAVAARKNLGQTTATRLLQAQAAQLAGDHRAAHDIYTALAQNNDSATLGYRGLIMAALKAQDWAEAERLTEKLRRLKPETPWLSLIQFELATRNHQWADARAALTRATQAHLCEPARAHEHQAALLLTQAASEARQGLEDRALQLLEQAARQAPNWLPALAALAEKQVLAGHGRSAARLIERIWSNDPYMPLVKPYATLGKQPDDPLHAYKQIEKLVKQNPEHTLSRLALAETALAADLWGEARRHLMAIISRKDATQSVFRLLARLEQRETGDEAAVNRWLMHASEALPDPRWLCNICGNGTERWQALCPSCNSFNSMQYRIPGLGRLSSKVGLLVSALDARA